MRDEAAEAWGVGRGGVVDALVLMPFLGALVVIAAWANRPIFHLLTDDDSLLEWLQFLGYVAATALGAAIALRFHRLGNRPMTALYVLFTLGCLFIAGEEVSWGQRMSRGTRRRRSSTSTSRARRPSTTSPAYRPSRTPSCSSWARSGSSPPGSRTAGATACPRTWRAASCRPCS
jgi:hypothetical protein